MAKQNQIVTDTLRWPNEAWGLRYVSISPPIVEAFHEYYPQMLTATSGTYSYLGGITPGYKQKLINKEWIQPLNYSADEFLLVRGGFYRQNKVVTLGLTSHTRNFSPTLAYGLGSIDFTPDWDDITAKALKNLKGKNWDAGVFLGEARKTSDLLYTTVTRMNSLVRDLRRGRFEAAMAHLGIKPSGQAKSRFDKHYGRDPVDAASRSLLEVQFGWKPLLSDLSKAWEVLTDQLRRRHYDRYLKVSARSESVSNVSSLVTESSPHRTYDQLVRTRAAYRMVFYFEADAAVEAAQTVNLLNPISTIWELTPWSFLIDYFTTIGQTIEILDACVGKSFKFGTRSYRVEQVKTWSNPVSSSSNEGEWGSAEWKYVRKRREVLYAFPNVPLPRFDPQLNVGRIWNIVGLLGQQLSKLDAKRGYL